MTNGEKYKNAQERIEAFDNYCNTHNCEECLFVKGCEGHLSAFRWLDLEAEDENPLPCPFCGNDMLKIESDGLGIQIHCLYCGYRSIRCGVKADPIAAHNRVAKAVKESEVQK